jgi:myo-inositol-1(or 4)-monophosphatase
MLGSAAIHPAWLAEGQLDATVTLSSNARDTSAGVVLAREDAHQIVDTDGQPCFLHSTAIVAAHPDLLTEVQADAHDL